MRVVIAGGAGFIGSHLCDRYLSDGHSVIAIDNLITGNANNVSHRANNPHFQLKIHDICEPFEVDGTIDLVLNFASPASPVDYLEHPLATLKVGSYGTHNTLELARVKGASYLLASTSEVYGDPLEHPQRETYYGNVNSIGVRSVYDEAKRYAEAATMAYHREYGLNTHIVRIFNTYGPRMRLNDGRVVPNFVDQALKGEALSVYGNGMQTRSFQYVSDLVEGVVRLAASDYHLPVNIGNPQELTINQFAEAVNRLTDNPAGTIYIAAGRTEDDPQTRKPDIARAKTILSWQPEVDLMTGLSETVKYFESFQSASENPAAT
ncbi:MAG: SDR family oxidoreductase [Chloroflexi bacterium]|nr:SDR family oxidoreductase [Chloroflexota bacterium]